MLRLTSVILGSSQYLSLICTFLLPNIQYIHTNTIVTAVLSDIPCISTLGQNIPTGSPTVNTYYPDLSSNCEPQDVQAKQPPNPSLRANQLSTNCFHIPAPISSLLSPPSWDRGMAPNTSFDWYRFSYCLMWLR